MARRMRTFVLTDREAYVLAKRREVPRVTLSALGKELGITRERVRQIFHRAAYKEIRLATAHLDLATPK